MTTTMTLPPAGWYPDGSGAPQLRWWNGRAWTENVEPFRQDDAVASVAVNRMRDEPLVTSLDALRAAAGYGPR